MYVCSRASPRTDVCLHVHTLQAWYQLMHLRCTKSTDVRALPTDARALPTDKRALPMNAHALSTDAHALSTDAHALPRDARALSTQLLLKQQYMCWCVPPGHTTH